MYSYNEILESVIELIRPLAPAGRTVAEGTDLVTDLEFDSLKVMSLIEQVEDRFDISVPLNILPYSTSFNRSRKRAGRSL